MVVEPCKPESHWLLTIFFLLYDSSAAQMLGWTSNEKSFV